MSNYARRAFYSPDLAVKRSGMGCLHRIRWSAAPICRRSSHTSLFALFTPFCGHVGMEQPGTWRVGPKTVGNLQVYVEYIIHTHTQGSCLLRGKAPCSLRSLESRTIGYIIRGAITLFARE